MKQKILLFMLLILAMPMTMMAQIEEIGDIVYKLDYPECSVVNLSKYFKGSVLSIPPTISWKGKTYKVRKIDLFGKSELKNVILPDSVTICNEAFYSCRELNIIINDINSWYTFEIEKGAFRYGNGSMHCTYRLFDKNNTEITDVVVPSDKKSSFRYCILNSITFPSGSLEKADVQYCQMKSIILPDDVEEIYDDSFSDCSELESVTLPNSVKKIGSAAFSGCRNLKSITIPSSVRTIGSYAFVRCENLKSINIPNGVTSIGSSAFSGTCENFESLTIPSSVTEIESNAFCDCRNLKSLIIENPNVSIGVSAFYKIPEDAKIKLGNKEIKASQLEGTLSEFEIYHREVAAAEKEYDAKVRQLEKRMGISNDPRLNEVIKAGRSFSTVKEYLKLVNDRFSFKLSIDKGARKCYDMYGPSGSGFISSIVKKGYIWVTNGKITTVVWN